MPWGNWKVLLIIILANYVVFSIVGAVFLPVAPPPAPTRSVHPTFTPGALPLERATLSLNTPPPTSTVNTTVTSTASITPSLTITPTGSP
jgi:hypothetical protein